MLCASFNCNNDRSLATSKNEFFPDVAVNLAARCISVNLSAVNHRIDEEVAPRWASKPSAGCSY